MPEFPANNRVGPVFRVVRGRLDYDADHFDDSDETVNELFGLG